jgi:hypothetical protein
MEDLARIVERLAVTSAPFQAFLIDVRKIYTWEDPKRTAKWAMLWYTQHIMGYVYFWVIYSTIRNWFQPTSVQTIRQSVSRSVDRKRKVQAWGELIQRHGKDDWIEPLLDELGPLIQRQLGDLADYLEVLINFRRHERPDKTMASLVFFGSCLAITLLADMEFCMKVVWFIVGLGFFFTYPIGTRFPKYRMVVSAWRWIMWDIPTHAELAILKLQQKAVMRDADLTEFDYSQPGSELSEIERPSSTKEEYTFNVFHNGEKGRLVVNRTGIELQRRYWAFSTLCEMRKVDEPDADSKLKNMAKLGRRLAEGLEFIFSDGSVNLLLHPADRDRVFNLVLAWSGLKWQALHIERHRERSKTDQAVRKALQ